MFLLKTTVMILFFNAATPVPYGEAITISFASRGECEAKAALYGERVARVVADELKRTEAPATVASVETRCVPIGTPA